MKMKLGFSLAFLLLLMAACQSEGRPTAVSPTLSPTAVATNPPTPSPTPALTVPTTPEVAERLEAPPRRLRAGELLLAADVDAIPAIFADDTLFVDAAAGSEEWGDEELVIGLRLGDDARAYPIRLLSSHEIVNDTVNGRPVAVTWCPLCFSAIVFDRVVERELTFGVSGYLYHNNLVMYDHQTNTLWSQLLGQAIRGGQSGETLDLIPSIITSWGEWKADHPDTRVLSAEALGQQADTLIDPYAGYYTSGAAGLGGGGNDLLKPKQLVVGMVADGEPVAYPLSQFFENGVLNAQPGELPTLFYYDTDLKSVLAFQRQAAGRTLTFAAAAEPGVLVDEETGTRWQAQTGTAVSGPLEGERLTRLSAPLVYWFAWSDLYPDTRVYGIE